MLKYPRVLWNRLVEESKKRGHSVSKVVIDDLMKLYGLDQ